MPELSNVATEFPMATLLDPPTSAPAAVLPRRTFPTPVVIEFPAKYPISTEADAEVRAVPALVPIAILAPPEDAPLAP